MNGRLKLLFATCLLTSINTYATPQKEYIDNVDLDLFQGNPVNIIYRLKSASPQSRSLLNSVAVRPDAEPLFPEFSKPSILSRSTNNEYNLDKYFIVEVDSTDKEKVKQILSELKNNPEVDTAYIEPPVESASITAELNSQANNLQRASVDDFTFAQYHLNGKNGNNLGTLMGGMDAKYAWTLPGGKGQEVDIVSIEMGAYHFNHDDLPYPFLVIGDTSYMSASSPDHDTQSVGVMTAFDNGYGVTGIANQARQGWAKYAHGQNLIKVAQQLKPGSVIQLGVQYRLSAALGQHCDPSCLVPADWSDAVVDAIRYATKEHGIHVIQAAGNGFENLDHAFFAGKFDRSKRDSGAIMVAASDPYGNVASFSNYGSRIDSFSWGKSVTTTAGGNNDNESLYTHHFNGTSSANPIVAATAASLQGIAIAHGKGVLSPQAMRTLLTDTGYVVTSPATYKVTDLDPNIANSQFIGTHPDLHAASIKLLSDEIINQPPVAIASISTATLTGAGSVDLSGEESSDFDGDLLTYQWRQVSPLQPLATFSSSQSANTSAQLQAVTQDTVYVFELKVSDGQSEAVTNVTLTQTPDSAPTYPMWDKATTYSRKGNIVIWKGNTWTNQWWTKGNEPSLNNPCGVWRSLDASGC
ncbi:S8 family peptidase [Motilimonas pumila]|uniref:Chitin-binding type-3 domain-containing protein n=1 Tax=Motilimonas pumila TaxID=2303987 RepID=A0A418YJP0_9GAMM|nr:S8 family serine peptidase [Motilimonas pumila]RJG51165.1 hypothetical protein D1Z90_00020 [Motilimonas pumila]